MKVGIDGGAFQQGIAAGIFNVQVNLMNCIQQARPDISFVLVMDPRFPEPDPTLLSRLTVQPTFLYGKISPAHRIDASRFLTPRQSVRFKLDDLIVQPEFANGRAVYDGAPPRKELRIVSRTAVPSEVTNSADNRRLGVAISRITVASLTSVQILLPDDDRLAVGFHPPEPGLRWTDGAAVIPLPPHVRDAPKIRVEVHIEATQMVYPAGFGVLDRGAASLAKKLERVDEAIETRLLGRKMRALGIEAYIVNHFMPARFEGIKSFAILHDMIPVLFPEFFHKDALNNFEENLEVMRRADHIFSVSRSSRKDLLEHEQICASKVSVCENDVSPVFRPTSSSKVKAVRTKLGIGDDKYILCVGTLEPRKNHARLIEAFSISGAVEDNVKLIFIGKAGWGTERIHQGVARLGLSRCIMMFGNVSDEELAALYGGALFLAYPSLYEGFGLPVLEALACNCPVLTSNRASMPDIAGDSAIYVDPDSVESIAEGIRMLLSSKDRRTQLARRGLERRKHFDWRRSAGTIISVLEA